MKPTRKNADEKPKVGEYRCSRAAAAGQDEQFHKDAVAYFEQRQRKLHVVATTRTRSGQILDWVRRDSQLPSGKIAAPPPILEVPVLSKDRKIERVRFELEKDAEERAPEHTVPILRKDLSNIRVRLPLRKYLSKRRGKQHLAQRQAHRVFAPPPEEGGSHWHSESRQSVICFGGEGFLSVYDPYTESSDDFSLLQIGIFNDEEGYMQSAEAGIQEMQDIYGDWVPHLFVYYTTNGYAEDGDNKGGYNQDVDGWVQYDGSIYPGATFTSVSTPGGPQYELFIKYQFYQGNWWFRAGDRWIGYYPASLYEGNRSVFSSLGDHANWLGFWGEVFDSDDVEGPTSTTMGSGYWAESQWPWAAFQKNLRVQVDREGAMRDYNSNSIAVDSPNMYDLQTHMLSGTDWGSYQWLGGPGAH